MKSIIIISITALLFLSNASGQGLVKTNPDKTIFVTGGVFNVPFIRYVASLTNKPNPKICFIPTASADNPNTISAWYEACTELPLKLYVLRDVY